MTTLSAQSFVASNEIYTRQDLPEQGKLSECQAVDDNTDSPWEISDSEEGSSRHVPLPTPSQASETTKSPRSSSTTDLDNASPNMSSSLLDRLIQSIKHGVSCLYRIPLRRPAPIQRLKENAAAWSLYQHFDILHVQDMFPKAPLNVTRTLGIAISRRRQLLNYREHHNENLQTKYLKSSENIKSPFSPADTKPEEHPTTNIPSDTMEMKATVKSQMSSHQDTVRTKATTFVGKYPQPLYSPSIAETRTSKASTYTGKLAVRIPKRPRSKDGAELEEFECPFCFTLTCITTPHQWK